MRCAVLPFLPFVLWFRVGGDMDRNLLKFTYRAQACNIRFKNSRAAEQNSKYRPAPGI